MVSKEQKRSEFALEKIDSLGSVKEDLVNFIVGTPTMILQNGFGQTMAFFLSKSGLKKKHDKHTFVFDVIAEWTQRENPDIQKDPKSFLELLSKLDQTSYMTLQEETLKMLQWLKRYARAFQDEDGKGGD